MARPPIASTPGRPDQEKVRPSTRARAIVFRALRIVAEFVRADRGARAARELLLALASAWDRRVLDLEGSPEDILTRLQRAGDLLFSWSRQTIQAAFARLHEACPLLFVRVRPGRAEYAIPFGELREACERLEQLDRWNKSATGARICRDIADPPEIEINHQLHSGLSRSSAPPASHAPGSPDNPGPPGGVGDGELELLDQVGAAGDSGANLDGQVRGGDELGAGGDAPASEVIHGPKRDFEIKAGRAGADPEPSAPASHSHVTTPPTGGASAPELEQRLAAAREDLARLGPSIQGMSGDRRAFVAGCIGGDWAIPPEIWADELARWNCDGCLPPWVDKDLAKKLESALRNRKRPYGYKAFGLHDAPLAPPKPRPENAQELWAQCIVPTQAPAFLDIQVMGLESWLNSRRLSCKTLPDVARLLPWKAPVPSWATFDRQPWSHTDFRLVFPLYDATGELVGVRARRLDKQATDGAKEVLPAGRRAVGLAFASEAAVAMLRGEKCPSEVWIVEGGPDFLTLCTLKPEAAILGVFEGSWDHSLAARIPPGARVILATHPDTAGRQYSLRVASSLPSTVEMRRLVIPDGDDVNSLWTQKRLDLEAHVPHEIDARGPSVRVKAEAPWTRRAIEMLRRYNYAFEGTSRELARVLFIANNKRFTNSTVRGLARALERLALAHQLPKNVVLVPARHAPTLTETWRGRILT